jgi:hypothetical protein
LLRIALPIEANCEPSKRLSRRLAVFAEVRPALLLIGHQWLLKTTGKWMPWFIKAAGLENSEVLPSASVDVAVT